MPNISIVRDFDGTLTPQDTTTKVVELLEIGQSGSRFWNTVKSLRGDRRKPKWEHVLASGAPIWMHALSRIAFAKRVPLNSGFFEVFVKPHIALYDRVPGFPCKLRLLLDTAAFKAVDLRIHHFIITTGLKNLVELLLGIGASLRKSSW